MLFKLKQKPKTKPDIPSEIDGIRIKPSTRAKRMSLRVDMRSGDVVLTWPIRKIWSAPSEKSAQRFIADNRGWINQQKQSLPEPPVIGAGSRIDVCGTSYAIVHVAGRGVTRFEGDCIIVHGKPEYLQRRLKDFLKLQAEEILSAATRRKTLQLGLKPASVRIMDPKSRWGSCGPDGRIMFSWRLVLAPPAVMDYVVAHEVAHRVHMNHSRRFWALCLSLCEDGVSSRRWLKKNGHRLMGI